MTVITEEDIQNSPAQNIPDILKTQPHAFAEFALYFEIQDGRVSIESTSAHGEFN